jgi:hypothetical protein
MRRVILLCLLSVAFRASHAQTTMPEKETRTPQSKNHPPALALLQQQAAKLTCGRKIAPNGYQPLPAVTSPAGYREYAGSLTTWAPIDNDKECHIRQLYFTIPDTIVEGPVGDVVGPDILVALYKVGSDTPVNVPISFDIVSFIDGSLYYRIDAQSPKNLHGDYVMKVRVVGKER